MRIRLLLIFSLLFRPSIAADKYWISFKDKNGVSFDPYVYFDQRAIDQRLARGISLTDSTDFPVSNRYLSAVSQFSDSVSYSSRWLNGVAVYTDASRASAISSLSFVRSVMLMRKESIPAAMESAGTPTALSANKIKLLKYQTDRMNGRAFHERKLDGKGIRIAIFDAGFPGYKTHPAFEHLRKEKKIVATYDFIQKKEEVDHGHWHGTGTLSCVAGKMDTLNIGLATGAEILLARTEYAVREPAAEEEYWLAAMEWADKLGANIVSSSLGYTDRRYFNFEMNGKNSLVAHAATIAAQKGILVINAAGNEGSDAWHFIDTPADADSVLTVGGTDPYTDHHISFSSYGPTSDGRLKPNVSAPANTIIAIPGGYAERYGTSFSTPLVAGFAACAWQHNTTRTNMELFNAIEESSHLYPYFDYAHGFGIPQADKIMGFGENPEPTFDFVIVNDEVKIILREKYSYLETESALGYQSARNFYYKVEDASGVILKYVVLLADKKEMMHFTADMLAKGQILTIHFEGYTGTLDLQDEDSQK